MAIIRKQIEINEDETIESFGNKLDVLNIEHSHLELEKEFKSGFRGQTITIMYDKKDRKWFATKWNDGNVE
jgi:superfamily II helicase